MYISRLFQYLVLFFSLITSHVYALTGVNPDGVNIKSTGATSAFITFQGTAGERSTDAFWCSEITVPAATVTSFDPCVPGTVLGRLPVRFDQSRVSGTGGQTNLTDIMTIPPSVSRRAFQLAKSGDVSSFFYVRRFVNAAGDPAFIALTCRMAGGGARVPFALMHVNLLFKTEKGDFPVYLIQRGQKSPPLGAIINYNGSGRLKGRWEVVLPGDQQPEPFDLLSEASLPVERRALQKRYKVLSRFDKFLPPTGKFFLPGPPPNVLPTRSEGHYLVLLRIEATRDREGNSNTNAGIAFSGGLAGFPLPVLRYFVGNQETINNALSQVVEGDLALMLPQSDGVAYSNRPLNFSWVDVKQAHLYELELVNAQDEVIISAKVKPGAANYTPPPWVFDHIGETLQWRVKAYDQSQRLLAQSVWRKIQIETDEIE